MVKTTTTGATKTNAILSEKQQLLLSRFHDGECSCVSAFYVRRLLSKNPSAKRFLSELEDLSSQCTTLAGRSCSVDLWGRIDMRIEQEQRAELYLGAYRPPARPRSILQRIDLKHTAIGGVSGAAIAAVVLMVVSRPQQIISFSAPSAAPIAPNQLIQPAGITSYGSQRALLYQANPINGHRSIETGLEVDWMRANGSLRLIPDPGGSSAIIWVHPRSRLPVARRLPPQIKPTPLGLTIESAPGAASTLVQIPQQRQENGSIQSMR